MYNVILVDDEIFELNMLSRLSVWEANDLCVVKTFTNAIDALEYIKNNKVDVIVSDVVMPKLSGIEFLTTIRKEYGMSIIFVFISAYSDFSYTREAIINNVFDYVLKPINITEINALCKRIKDDLLEREMDEEPNLNIMKCQQAMIDCVNEKITLTQMEQTFRTNLFSYSAEKTKNCIVTIKIDAFEKLIEKWNYTVDRFYYAIENIINNGKYSFVPLKYKGNEISYLCIIHENDEVSDVTNELKKVFSTCESILKYTIKYQIMSNIDVFDNIRDDIKKCIGMVNTEMNVKQNMEEAIKFVEENYKKDISLMQMAEHLSLSTYHTSRLFKKYTGESFVNYLSSFRIREARSLLMTTNMSFTQIALQTGFTTERKFYRTFLNVVGCTPTEYRNKFLK